MTDSTTNDKGNPVPGDYLSRRQAAQFLKVAPTTLDRLVRLNRIPIWQVPGHSRRLIDRAAVQRLADAAMEARA